MSNKETIEAEVEELTRQIIENATEGELDKNINSIIQLYFSIYINAINIEGDKKNSIPNNIDEFIEYINGNVNQSTDINDITEYYFKTSIQNNIPKALTLLKKLNLDTFGTIDLVNMTIIYSDNEQNELVKYNSTVPNYANGGRRRRRRKKRQTKKTGGRCHHRGRSQTKNKRR